MSYIDPFNFQEALYRWEPEDQDGYEDFGAMSPYRPSESMPSASSAITATALDAIEQTDKTPAWSWDPWTEEHDSLLARVYKNFRKKFPYHAPVEAKKLAAYLASCYGMIYPEDYYSKRYNELCREGRVEVLSATTLTTQTLIPQDKENTKSYGLIGFSLQYNRILRNIVQTLPPSARGNFSEVTRCFQRELGITKYINPDHLKRQYQKIDGAMSKILKRCGPSSNVAYQWDNEEEKCLLRICIKMTPDQPYHFSRKWEEVVLEMEKIYPNLQACGVMLGDYQAKFAELVILKGNRIQTGSSSNSRSPEAFTKLKDPVFQASFGRPAYRSSARFNPI